MFDLWRVDPGFNPRNLITFWVSPQPSLAAQPPVAIRSFIQRMQEQLASTPQIRAASLDYASSPMINDSDWYFWFAGRSRPAHITDLAMALVYIVEPDYLKTLQIPLIRGRFLKDTDSQHSPAVVVIDQALAEKYFPGQDPIGQYLNLNTDPSDHDKWPDPRIVGVAGHVNQWGLGSDASIPLHSQMYLPMARLLDKYMPGVAQGLEVHVRGRDTLPAFEPLRDCLLRLIGGLVAFETQPMQKIVSESIAGKRFAMRLLTAFALLALIWAASVSTAFFPISSGNARKRSVSASLWARAASRSFA